MKLSTNNAAVVALFLAIASPTPSSHAIRTAPQQAAPAPAGRVLGTITAISGNALTIKSDAGAESQVTIGDATRMVRTAPGEKTLAGATMIKLTDLSVGDRVLVRAAPGADATLLIAMKQSDIAQRQQQQQQDWERRGISGLVKSVDAATGSIVVNMAAGPAPRPLTIQTTSSTAIRQYAPDSVRFDQAKVSSLSQVKTGDQLRARGDREADTMKAEEIVFGSFRNIAGTIVSTSPSTQTVTVLDLVTKKPVVIHLNEESQLHKLPAETAQRIAMRLKGGAHGAVGQPQAHAAEEQTAGNPEPQPRAGGLGQMLQQSPSITMNDLHKGEAVMIVASDGTPSEVTGITLLSGVEPILQASPGASESVFNASWSLGGGQEAANAQQPQ